MRPVHHIIAARLHQVPEPFRAFAVRSDEPCHAFEARAPLGQLHLVRTAFIDAECMARIVAQGQARVEIETVSEVTHASVTLQDLAEAAPRSADQADQADLATALSAALQLTGVLGDDTAGYRRSVDGQLHYLACRGAGFHNDVARHWSRSLFWLLTLDATDVEFVQPHAGVRLALAPGDLLVFDQTMAHGLCRPQDRGQAVAASFESGAHCHQLFLTGELLLSDAQWAALGAPWLAVEAHQQRGALDLLVAEFDERSGAIKQLRALADGLQRGVCHVDDAGTERRIDA